MKIDTSEKHKICLKLPLLLIKVRNGMLACAYLDIKTFNKTKEACALVKGVSDYDDMLNATVYEISKKARRMGVECGMSGRRALEIMNTNVGCD